MPGHGLWCHTNLRHPDPVSGNPGNQHHRLGVDRQRQRFFRAVLDQQAHVFTQRISGFPNCLTHLRMLTPRVEHADRLRTLTRKNKSE